MIQLSVGLFFHMLSDRASTYLLYVWVHVCFCVCVCVYK